MILALLSLNALANFPLGKACPWAMHFTGYLIAYCVSQIEAQSEQFEMYMQLDVNTEIYPLNVGDKFTMVLAPTLSLDGNLDTGYFTQYGFHSKLPSSTHVFSYSIFISLAVGALKVTGIRMAHTNRSRCSGHGGGALGTWMSLFDRFARDVKSYANAIVSSFEDPEKILEQSVLEMNDDLTKMRQATAQVCTGITEVVENRCKAAQQASEDWYRRAQLLALGKGDEDLAPANSNSEDDPSQLEDASVFQ
ncbi:hypothetical protein HHK36_013299 [Tetracentron sinense]|uniref:Uncharacterized protein n=1 Tax=Tetracentron sinense TaxID=13715 RepID=A0A834ZAF1_TETSI|nr:hypothetical protein HHK36_013299 [Tetracentron sinense]